MSVEAEIRTLVYTDIETYGVNNSIPVEMPNVSLKTQPQSTYLSVSMFNVDPDPFVICSGSSRREWIPQISVYVREGVGEIKAMSIVDDVCSNLFPNGRRLVGPTTTFTVIEPPSPASGGLIESQEDAWYFVPVQFRILAIK